MSENENLIVSLCENRIKSEPEYKLLYEALSKYEIAGSAYRQGAAFVTGLCETPTAALISSVSKGISKDSVSLVIAADEKTAYRYKTVLSYFTDGVYVFPARDFVFHNVSAFSHESEYERLDILRKITKNEAKIVITVPEAALSFLPPAEKISNELCIKTGDNIEINTLLKALVDLGYTSADTVEGKGQFSHRGDIVDIFPPSEIAPLRLEFFGDELDAAGYFDILTQRRTENVQEITLTKARELILSDEEREKVVSSITRLRNLAERKYLKEKSKVNEEKLSKLNEELSDLENNSLHNLDKYIPAVWENKTCLLDYAKGPVLVLDFKRSCERLKAAEWQNNENITALISSGEIEAKYCDFMYGTHDFFAYLCRRPSVIFDIFTSRVEVDLCGVFSFVSKQTVSFSQNLDILCDDLSDYIEADYKIVILTKNMRASTELYELLSQKGSQEGFLKDSQRDIKAVIAGKKDISDGEFLSGTVFIVCDEVQNEASLSGFEFSRSHFVLLTEESALGAVKSKKSALSSKSAGQKILSYSDLKEGDYVVHTVHGIARYDGIRTLTVDGVTKDYITLQYAGSDVLYVPVGQLDRVSRYASAGENVKLSRMGAPEWQKVKSKAKKAAKDMAKQLITLYAERKKLQGYAFSPDSEWQSDFESRFEYDETEGQITSINEIKSDMEKSYPMDRLLCGDVGFGKTEVALRAVFKCVAEGKQAAILVPTTILAWQHYRTTLSRMHSFPIKVDMLSRFCSAADAKKIEKRLETGETDVIIGTHKLLQKDIKFKDLGLLVVDEEQRFGVAHKERLKEISRQVDVLTLTATPIPRTLNMAMAGIRDMSVLEEAPGDRYPVQTYVLEYDEFIIGEAIKKELRRGGQVFYLYNKVEGIEEVASKLRQIVPEAEIACAHGKMPQDMLSKIWKSLVDGETDILVCTTIIETGVDVPNANTLIIEDADRLGLSQLHQIRGRIGRSNRKAYAYITWKSAGVLSEIAQKRLLAIKEFTEFGSGFKIAMRDLEIRGAGNLLGAEQSGHMEAVGYDLYIKILEEAVLEEKGIAPQKEFECTIDLHENAYIPEKYIKLPSGRIEIYKKIASAANKSDADEIFDELTDRYGDVPPEVKNLIDISLLRTVGAKAGIRKIEQSENKIRIYPEKVIKEISIALVSAFRGRVLLSMGNNLCYNIKISSNERPIEAASQILKIYTQTTENL